MMKRVMIATLMLATLAMTSRADAGVTRVEVKTRTELGAYEKIVGTVYFSVDPSEPRNQVIADIDKAPRNESRQVGFSSDLYILRPRDEARANGIALVEVLNRGKKLVMSHLITGGKDDPSSEADLGDRFLLDRGFTLVWVGWEFDVQRRNGLLGISVPSAQGVEGTVWGDFTPANANERQTVGDLVGYAAADPASPDNRLTVRDSPFGPEETIDRSRWTIAGNTVTVSGGVTHGRIYRVSYRARELPISGLGLAAVRDVGSWVKYAPDALVHVNQALAFGESQSGRFLRTFLHDGFNGDEKGRLVYDAVWAHIAGAAGLDVNARGATPTSLTLYEITRFPYANQAMRDPISGRTDGLVDNDRARAFQPKVFFTNSSVEYWGGGRDAALIHTAPDGSRDLALPDNLRVYFLTGAQHGPARFPTSIGQGQQPDNPLEFRWTMRALMVAMEQWMRSGTAPPPSRYPRLSDGTLVDASKIAFPAIPGVQSPTLVTPLQRNGQRVPFLVPQVDADGNELAGIRTPESLVPLATYTGWNFRKPSIGGTSLLVSLLGARLPFPATANDARATGDPRTPIDARYRSRDAYMSAARTAADRLVEERLLLPADREKVIQRMSDQWDAATAPRPSGPRREKPNGA